MKRTEIAELFDRYGPMVYRRALALLGKPEIAEEATQEVFLRALKAGESFEGRSRVSTWLYSITTNYCLNLLRNENRRRELWQEHSPKGLQATHEAPEELMLMRTLLSEADEEQAQAAVYVYIDGMSQNEAAELLGVSRRTVGNLLDRFNAWARKRMNKSAVKSET